MERRFGNGRRGGRRFFFFPFVAIAFIALGGLAVMLLWNNIIPLVIPSVRRLNYGQAVGLLVLSRILFGGFRGRPGGGFRGGPGAMRRGGYEWREKWNNMTDEERTKFKEEWRERCRGRRDR